MKVDTRWLKKQLAEWLLACGACLVFVGMIVGFVLGTDWYVESLPSAPVSAHFVSIAQDLCGIQDLEGSHD